LTRDALFDQILQNPAEDAPRLIYADWLEEHGDPRGEFIRLQCQLAKLPDDGAQRDVLHGRAAKILQLHRDTWLNDVAPELRAGAGFVRGFIENWSLTVQQLSQLPDSIFRSAPLLHSLQVVGDLLFSPPAIVINSLGSFPQLKRVKHLQLQGAFNGATLAALLGSDYFEELDKLSVRMFRGLDTRLLTRAQVFAKLTSLELEFCEINDTKVQEIAGARCFPALQRLDVSRNGIGAAGVRAVVRGQRLSQLTAFGMEHNEVGDDGALVLAATASSSRFRWLNLAGAGLTDTGAQPLAHSPQLHDLEHLDLRSNPGISNHVRDQLRQRYAERVLL